MATKKKKVRNPRIKLTEKEQQAQDKKAKQASQKLAIIMFTSGILLLAIEFIPGKGLWLWLKSLLFGMFGLSSVLLPLALIYISVLIAFDKLEGNPRDKIWQIAVFVLLISGISEVLSANPYEGANLWEKLQILYKGGLDYKTGGIFSTVIGWPLLALCGRTGAVIIMLLFLFAFFMILTGISLVSFFSGVKKSAKTVGGVCLAVGDTQKSKKRDRQQREQAEYERLLAQEQGKDYTQTFDYPNQIEPKTNEFDYQQSDDLESQNQIASDYLNQLIDEEYKSNFQNATMGFTTDFEKDFLNMQTQNQKEAEKAEEEQTQQPQTPLHAQSQNTVHEKPQTPLHAQPQNTVHEKPQTPLHSQPQNIVHEKPQTPLHAQPRNTVQEKPQTPLHAQPQRHYKTPVKSTTPSNTTSTTRRTVEELLELERKRTAANSKKYNYITNDIYDNDDDSDDYDNKMIKNIEVLSIVENEEADQEFEEIVKKSQIEELEEAYNKLSEQQKEEKSNQEIEEKTVFEAEIITTVIDDLDILHSVDKTKKEDYIIVEEEKEEIIPELDDQDILNFNKLKEEEKPQPEINKSDLDDLEILNFNKPKEEEKPQLDIDKSDLDDLEILNFNKPKEEEKPQPEINKSDLDDLEILNFNKPKEEEKPQPEIDKSDLEDLDILHFNKSKVEEKSKIEEKTQPESKNDSLDDLDILHFSKPKVEEKSKVEEKPKPREMSPELEDLDILHVKKPKEEPKKEVHVVTDIDDIDALHFSEPFVGEDDILEMPNPKEQEDKDEPLTITIKPKYSSPVVETVSDDYSTQLLKDEDEIFEAKKVSEFEQESKNYQKSDINRGQAGENQAKKPNAYEEYTHYDLPPTSMLNHSPTSSNHTSQAELDEIGNLLIDTLASFKVQATMVGISRGPSVTRYEIKPATGVKLSKIVGLGDDIALNLSASGVIVAPIPGKPAVGIEVPNKTRDILTMREIIESDDFDHAQSSVSVALGKDIAGNNIVFDIATMPHMLIAGSTGAGKSVCMNSIIMSILYKSSPEDVRLLMIDPKVVELGVYNGIPHLLVPVVTDPKKAAGALAWAVKEMLKRYELFAENNVRDIKGYNALKGENITHMPQIVIIIDELADLMMAASKEVEDSICRLAQMARAAGMHLIIATQRPSVDVITGLIKANVPSRIAFAVTSQIDSRTILDSAGAEKLLGKGDMLFSPIGVNKPLRVQGCLLEDEEINKVVNFIKSGGAAEYDEEIVQEIENQALEKGSKSDKNSGGGFDDSDELLDEAIQTVVDAGKASTSSLQRKLRVGYARAARIIDEMEERGIVSPADGSKPRQVLITKQQWYEMKLNSPN